MEIRLSYLGQFSWNYCLQNDAYFCQTFYLLKGLVHILMYVYSGGLVSYHNSD